MTKATMKKYSLALAALALLATLNSPCSSALAQGTTAFTYQGQLRDGGTNANGNYTMTFALYDAPSGPTNLLGAPKVLTNYLNNGLFTVTLDFGNVFSGGARWLDITVQSGTNTPEELLPRVQIQPSPYALYAGAAGSLVSGNWNLGTGSYGPIQNGLLVYDNGSLVMALSTNGSYIPTLAPVPKMQTFTSGGTFTVPAGVNKIKVEMWGGGGGGGAWGSQTVNNATYYAGGGGGGAGAYAMDNFDVNPGDSYTITVGTGGGAGGGSGGASSINVNGTVMSAGGGSGGGSGRVNYPNFYPGNGGSGGQANNSSSVNFESAIGQGGNANTGGGQLGGNGGSAAHGGAGGWGNGGGANGKFPGGGGGGGANAGTPNGGAGAAGMVIVYF